MFYADDMIILAESVNDTKNSFKMFEFYCTQWKLAINIDKTTVMIFSKRKSRINNYEFTLYGRTLENIDSNTY